RCGVLLLSEEHDIPAYFGNRGGVNFCLFGPWRGVLQSGFIAFVSDLVSRDIPTFLSVPGPPGFSPAKTLLNDRLRVPVATENRQAIIDCLMDSLEVLANYKFEPNAF